MNPRTTKAAEALVKQFEYASRKHGLDRMFSDWTTVVTCCLANQTAEELYLETIKPYSKEELSVFAKAFAQMVIDYDDLISGQGWCDLLGHIQETITSAGHKSQFGQFFTPPSLCNAMAQIAIGKKTPSPGMSVADPTCGSGRTLLAGAFATDIPRSLMLHGADLDKRACQMAAINLLMHNLEGIILHRNSLSMQDFGGFYVHRYPMPWIEHFSSDQARQMEGYWKSRSNWLKSLKPVEPKKPPVTTPPNNLPANTPQLTLF